MSEYKATIGNATKASDQNFSTKKLDQADYVILDDDKFDAILVTTGGSDRTITLPAVADNDKRKIIIAKGDAGAGKVIIDGEGAETINGSATQDLVSQYERMTILSEGSEWLIVDKTAHAIDVPIADSKGKYAGATVETALGEIDATKIKTLTDDDYTVLDNDGYGYILVTTSAVDRTVTLPTAAVNVNRKLWIEKVDSGANKVIVDGEGAETINGSTEQYLYHQFDRMQIVCNGTSWFILHKSPAVIKTLTDADYTVLDNDGFGYILVTTSAVDRTVTLPTAADNKNRKLWIVKIDAGANKVIVDGEGAETINGSTEQYLYNQWERMLILCNGTSWFILHKSPIVDTGAAAGGKDGDVWYQRET